jgi:hypothetical protein
MVDFGRFMAAAGPVTEPVVVNDIGATGGPFDLMPERGDDDVLHGLVPMYEYDLLTNGQEPIEHIATPTSRHLRDTERR